ncbi:ABC transporter permease [Actinophytocola sp.]|uniref:ABC transporter permease n=1 Tax=Actinophytocola sp. TaxID=1872138 RepID=UPI003D6B2940
MSAQPSNANRVAVLRERMSTVVGRTLMFVILLGIWLLAANLQPNFVPTPWAVLSTVGTWLGDGTISDNIGTTLYEVFVGAALAFGIGIPVGLVLAQSRFLDNATRPYIDVMNAIPRIGLAPLFVLWFGLGQTSKIALVFSVLFFIVVINVHAGVKSVEREHIVLATLLGASRWDIAMKVLLPSLVPWIIASLRLTSAYGVSAAVIGEFVAGSNGLGYLLAYHSSVLNPSGSFAALFLLALVSLTLTFLTMLLERHALRWRNPGGRVRAAQRRREPTGV